MHIWIDADACPKPVKDIVFRAAVRVEVPVTMVANHFLPSPPSPLIKSVQVPAGFDVADDYIVQQVNTGDIVITADIPLAAEAVEKGADVINPRGEHYTPANIRQRLATRDFMEQMRSTGGISGGPPPYGAKEKQDFANALDRLLARHTGNCA